MRLHELSYVRSGDKGDVSNVVVLARDAEAYETIARNLTPDTIAEHMGELVKGSIEIWALPKLQAFQVVMKEALGGGVTRSLRIDGTGKSMCTILSRMPMDMGKTK